MRTGKEKQRQGVMVIINLKDYIAKDDELGGNEGRNRHLICKCGLCQVRIKAKVL